jgi:hypothetical protein
MVVRVGAGLHGRHAGGMHWRELVDDADGEPESGQAVQDVPQHSGPVSCMHDFNVPSHDAIRFPSVLDRLTQAQQAHVSCLPRPRLREFAMQFRGLDLVEGGAWIARRMAEGIRGIPGQFAAGALPAVLDGFEGSAESAEARGGCPVNWGRWRRGKLLALALLARPEFSTSTSPEGAGAWPVDLINSRFSRRHCLCQGDASRGCESEGPSRAETLSRK